MSNYLDNAIEKAILLAFTQHCEKYGASSMADMNDNILDQAKTTTNALLSMKDEMFKQNLEHRKLEAESMHNINSMTGMIPPLPIVPPKTRWAYPKVHHPEHFQDWKCRNGNGERQTRKP